MNRAAAGACDRGLYQRRCSFVAYRERSSPSAWRVKDISGVWIAGNAMSSILQSIRFDERGLIPAVVQDASTSDVLGLYHLDNLGLAEILRTGRAAFLQQLPSGQPGASFRLIDLKVSNDGALLTVFVESGPAASAAQGPVPGLAELATSPASELSVVDIGALDFGIALNDLYSLIADRKETRPEGSYTTYLFNSGLDKILKKIAEESGEVIIAAKNRAAAEIVSELADLFYHLLVLMVERGVKLADVQGELVRRRGNANGREVRDPSAQPGQN
jgi:phosphoribosyl-ATP pyrophosphohydrolase/phosphoribosyl-AMP cyclohydrolase